MMKRALIFTWGLCLLLTACQAKQSSHDAPITDRIAQAVAATLTAQPAATSLPTQSAYPTAAPAATLTPLSSQTPLPTEPPLATATPYPTFTPTATDAESIGTQDTTPIAGNNGSTLPPTTPDGEQTVIENLLRARDTILGLLGLLSLPEINCSSYVAVVDSTLNNHRAVDTAQLSQAYQTAYGFYLDFYSQMQTPGFSPHDIAADCRAALANDPGAQLPNGIAAENARKELRRLDPAIHSILGQFGIQ